MSFELGAPDAGGIDGTEPLGMTAKNGTPGGFSFVGGRTDGKGVKRGDTGLYGAFCGVLAWVVQLPCGCGLGNGRIWVAPGCGWACMVAAHGRRGRPLAGV